MNKRLYIGNLAFGVKTDELRAAFADFGEVREAVVVTDADTGNSRGFGFVEFVDATCAERALAKMEGQDLRGRPLRVSEAREKPPRRR